MTPLHQHTSELAVESYLYVRVIAEHENKSDSESMPDGAATDYYVILDITASATPQQIRDAYKRAALKTHPDRVPIGSPDRAKLTHKFQLVNDAYYTLSDPKRRGDYDSARRSHGFRESTSSPSNQDNDNVDHGQNGYFGFPWSNSSSKSRPQEDKAKSHKEQFGDVFEEMLKEEGLADQNGRPSSRFWGVVGGMSGAAMGFIVANVPGLIAGAVAGNRLGAVRDLKGKSVFDVFQELPAADKTKLLTQLALKVFSHGVGSC
ncbi:BgTH12-05655 [Blumeria graminis f. sp. triticale]|uniref:BgTH12-05655 n=1 Tax=Blumeria graminis f. sp. triticale TaxID=1689686 RepID=A0A9W4D8K8_BLUGR|nr:BgTH12-05655 [Blumeria graminis f. sp. triticale]